MTCAQNISANVDIKGFEYVVDVPDDYDDSQQGQESIAEKDPSISNFESTQKKKKRKRSDFDINSKLLICPICHMGGEMIVCHGGKHHTGCGQCYHISCIDRTEVPSGDWICMTCAHNISANVDIKGFEYLVDIETFDFLNIDESDHYQAKDDINNTQNFAN
jgi:RecJ-like exonuclease